MIKICGCYIIDVPDKSHCPVDKVNLSLLTVDKLCTCLSDNRHRFWC